MFDTAYYIQINSLCIVVLVLIVWVQWQNKQANTAIMAIYKRMVIVAILYCISDIVARVFNGTTFTGVRIVLEAANIVFICSPLVIAAFWIHFVFLISENDKALRSWQGKLLMIPLLLILLFIITNPIHGLAFGIDSGNNYYRKVGSYLTPVVCYTYSILSVLIGSLYLRRETDEDRGNDVRLLGLFLIPVLIAGAIQLAVYGISVFTCGYTLGLLLVFLNNQYEKISTDELTGLNNRREFKHYLNGVMRSEHTESMFLCMIDIDYFKSINDQYGHAEGDEALKRVTTILKKVCTGQTQRYFLGRYGGDEFVIAGVNRTVQDVVLLRRRIETISEEENQAGKKPYALQLSVGFVVDTPEHFGTPANVVEQADRNMYSEKKKRKEERIAFE